jgi:hypothetical protein
VKGGGYGLGGGPATVRRPCFRLGADEDVAEKALQRMVFLREQIVEPRNAGRAAPFLGAALPGDG